MMTTAFNFLCLGYWIALSINLTAQALIFLVLVTKTDWEEQVQLVSPRTAYSCCIFDSFSQAFGDALVENVIYLLQALQRIKVETEEQETLSGKTLYHFVCPE